MLLNNFCRNHRLVSVGLAFHRQVTLMAADASVEFACCEPDKDKGRIIMKKLWMTLACGLIASLAVAQTTTTTQDTTTTAPATTTTTTTYTTGTVTTYEPGKTIVVKSAEGPVSFALGTAANIVDAAGKIVTAPLRAGQNVRVYYSGPTDHRVVERVIVEE